MTHAEKLNLFLLVLNSNFAICIAFFLMSAVAYIVWQARENKMTLRDWWVYVPLGIMVAASMFVRDLGEFIVRTTVIAWRAGGAAAPLSSEQLTRIGVGSSIGLLGLLLMIRTISMARFGERMWLAALCGIMLNTTVILVVWLK